MDNAPKKAVTMPWKLPPEELQKQVAGYATLPMTKSTRGVVSIILWCLMGLTVLAVAVGILPGFSLLGLIVYVPLTILMANGHRWAIIALMVVYTFEKLWQMSTAEVNEFTIFPIFWLLFILMLLARALQVEGARRKK